METRLRRPADADDLALNGAGMFVSGGPNGDNGLSGKKLVVDAYGPTVPIGGGAWSGKDFHKVDRLGGLLARSLAKRAVLRALAGEVQVTLSYTPGCERPVRVDALLDGRPVGDLLARLGQPETGNQRTVAGLRGLRYPAPGAGPLGPPAGRNAMGGGGMRPAGWTGARTAASAGLARGAHRGGDNN